jgi:hypothetical protein
MAEFQKMTPIESRPVGIEKRNNSMYQSGADAIDVEVGKIRFS